uniref:NADH dehydrogenase subunit 5 n=1 Tax=Parachordodes pustulosus TaxID=3049253 RepID=UPI002E7878B6|nr:NADH dehydrogenase subunit 5 [Parachordodes pustulosus]WQH58896.1 NADH dehydrogenase subunit 5 [Parachordodes pustulosus]
MSIIVFIDLNEVLLNLVDFNMIINNINLSLKHDPFTSVFGITLILIIINVYFFSKFYMVKEKLYFFYPIMFAFSFTMFLLIYAPYYFFLLLGWDGLGLTSFYLIMFYQNYSSMMKANMTILINRVGDYLIVVCLTLSLGVGAAIAASSHPLQGDKYLICVFLIFAGFVKSAQLPWSGWLLAAMAAPTPISSLVHSSTLVCSGVILFMKLNELSMNWNWSALFLPVLSFSLAAIAAIFEKDLKKIIALSTLNQMSLLFISSFSSLTSTLSYMLSHAFFKSAMFMSSGFIFHSIKDSQDLRFSFSSSKFNKELFMISGLSLSAFYFSSGFYGKENIMMMLTSELNNFNFLTIFLFFLGSLLTFSYFFILLNKINFSEQNYLLKTMHKKNNPLFFLFLFLTLLSFFSTSPILNLTESYNFSSKNLIAPMMILIFLLLASLIPSLLGLSLLASFLIFLY